MRPRCFAQRAALLLTVSILWATPLAAQTPRFAELEQVVLAELAETKTPGAAVAVVQGDRVIYAKGFGVANVETGQAVSPEMLFRVGSMTKMYTAAALVQLAEEGKLDLNAPIGRYLEGLPPRLSAVTAHQLLSHTAGLADGASLFGPHDESALAAQVREYNDSHLFTDPGAIFSYANPGYVIAGHLVERLSGKPYSEAVKARVLEPLGMTRSTFQPTLAMTYPFSVGHAGAPEQPATVLRPMEDNAAIWPAGFLFSNTTDLARFAIAFMHGGRIDGKQALSPGLVGRLASAVAPLRSQVEGGSYGYGLMVRDHRGVRLVEHGGTMVGFASDFAMAPDQKVAVIVLANRRTHLMKTVEKALELTLPLAPKAEKPKPLEFTARELDEYVGRYGQRPGAGAELVRSENGLALKTGSAQSPLTKIGTDVFTVRLPGFPEPLRLAIVRGADGRIQYLHNRLRAFRRQN
jgi:CubicO group peptidase (beta-lactamase class C family)